MNTGFSINCYPFHGCNVKKKKSETEPQKKKDGIKTPGWSRKIDGGGGKDIYMFEVLF